jgi:two-component system chemotaxis sensor kinase CheA
MTTELSGNLRDIADKIAMELVFAEPGKDNGLLPANCLLLEIEEHFATHPAPETLGLGVRAARTCLDAVFETGVFSDDTIGRLGEWTIWFQSTLHSMESGLPIGALPEWRPATPPASAPVPAVAEAIPTGESPLILNLGEDAELVREFINESGEHLQNIEQGILKLEDNPSDPETLASIFRAFHTFKGGAGFLNLVPIHNLAHELESLLDLARQHKLAITNAVINVILDGGDTLKRFAEVIAARLAGADNSAPIVVPTTALIARIRALLRGEAEVPVKTGPPARTEPSPGPAKSAVGASSVKVDTQKLDGLIDVVGEMVIAQSLVVQNPALRSIQNEQLTRGLAELGRITKELQRTAMSLRMVPIYSTFQKMHRVVRDSSAKVGKKVELVTDGEDTELDRTIVEEISDPLIHMVRNSIDHGIEMPAARIEAGKPEQGTVSLRAFHQGGNIVIEIKDDGKGLDRAAILAKARERGLVAADEHLSDSEIFSLVFAPGFSTAEKVTELSGRGVGMDVVRRNIEKLRGKIEIQSRPGEGAIFSIFLPLTLAIIDGLLVGVGEHRYILPTLSVSESFRPTPGMIQTVRARGEMIDVRGQLRPLVRLYKQLGIEPTSTEPTESIVVVVQSSSDARCVLVDKLIGKQEVVIKSLGETFQSNPYVAGAAILGDGRVGLILDAQALVHLQAAPPPTHSGLAK